MFKVCESCKCEYTKTYFNRVKMLLNSRFCSKKCRGVSMIGTKLPEEIKLKISKSHTGKKRNSFSKEWLEKMSMAHLGKKNHFYGKTHSEETRKKLSDQRFGVAHPERRGENCHLWRGGVSSKNLMIRQSLEYRVWRKSVFERDKYKCQECGIVGNGTGIIVNGFKAVKLQECA